jgi:3-oxoacyl-[acyl-carrier protein] reductase
MASRDNRVAIVTGGGTGIGRAITHAFVRAGMRVAITGRRRAPLEGVQEELGDRILVHPGDVSDEAVVTSLFGAVDEWAGQIDVLVNNAGIAFTEQQVKRVEAQFEARAAEMTSSRRWTTLWDITSAMEISEWNEMLRVNLTAPFLTTRAALRRMRAARSGCIINITSDSAFLYDPFNPHYVAAKAGLNAFSRSVALEQAPLGIRVNAIAPGWTETALTEGIDQEKMEAATGDRIPLGRYGKPEEIASLALYLASDDAGFITGQTFVVNGGAATN